MSPGFRAPSPPSDPHETAVHEAITAVIERYTVGDVSIVTESDLQGHLFAELLSRLPERPIPLHADRSITNFREKVDLVVGVDPSIVIELKAEPVYGGMPAGEVCFWKEVLKDLARLERYVRDGVARRGHFLMLDEHGRHFNRSNEVDLPWRFVERDKRKVGWLWVEF